MNSSVFNAFLDNTRDVEERTASGKPFQTEVAAAEKHLPWIVARQVHEITSGRRRAKALTCVNIRNSLQLS